LNLIIISSYIKLLNKKLLLDIQNVKFKINVKIKFILKFFEYKFVFRDQRFYVITAETRS